MVEKPAAISSAALLEKLGWFPVILSALLLVLWLPFLLVSRLICLQRLVGIPLFVAYLGLFGFPLFAFIANWFFNKKFSVSFETNHKEILLAFWIWTVLLLWMLGFFLSSRSVPLPGFQTFFACA